MALHGTRAHGAGDALPSLVRRALDAARANGFAFSCRPEQGRLLQLLAAGAPTAIGETGTGCGVGLAWLASGARPGTRLTSVERDRGRAGVARDVFRDDDRVEILHGDWRRVEERGPYDLLVLDGGGQAKGGGAGRAAGESAADPARLLAPGGTVVIDDFTPATTWPPRFNGAPDAARLHWLAHPELRATELRLAPDLAVIVGTRLPSA
ncbi:SAM-dependent methyltransferase [Streptomyces sp. 3MP-14]|uniref:SAM-dependent methyltransferase n=1 Tax=Streptomyces mimosae TaxID=2586635 RepID=A0A5N6AAA9_9ACTN|nr:MULTISPECIES: class I SAM-dependent methyltransferase [Streptomyces]KAB8164690.1 SAM-dependent methyltransferase [Streptomyces mimosae]KAB8175606.1 SAM-dependent methyltransferase [Streptomyces sp. 3MP-14]